MKKIKNHFRFILYIFLFLGICNVVYPKNLNKYYKTDKISDYFSGVLLLYDNEYASSYKRLKNLEGLEEFNSTYPRFYQYSSINSGNFYNAYRYSKKLESNKIDNFESNLIIGLYYLKNGKYDRALKYFQKLEKDQKKALESLISISLQNWVSFLKADAISAHNLIENMHPRFKNIKKIQKTFANCFFDSNNTHQVFLELTSDKKTDFSRYNFFHANYLIKKGRTSEATDLIDRSLKLNPRNLILNQLKVDLNQEKIEDFNNRFDCRNLSNVSAEILYIAANGLSSQSEYQLSNFYLNLARFLNPNFISFDALYAENLYMVDKFEAAEKIYKKIINAGSVYSWHASKQIANILEDQGREDESVEFLKNRYNKISSPSVNAVYDYASFLKNNKKYEESINYYTKVLNLIDKDNHLYPKAADGRGIAYERTDNWEKAEKDFLNSLDVLPDQAYVINYLAYSWIEKGINIEKSLKMLERANRLKRHDGYITDSLGWALFKLERYQEAKKYLQLALMIMPSDPIINDHYGDVLWMNKQTIQSRYYWNYVLNSKEAEEELKKSAKEKIIFGLKPKS